MDEKAKRDFVPIKCALISTFNQASLEPLVSGLLKHCPDIRILSTGMTFKTIEKLLGPDKSSTHLQPIEEFLGHTVNEPGIPRTLDWRLAMGIMFDDDKHKGIRDEYGLLSIELVVCNMGVYSGQISKGPDIETARCAIEIERAHLIRTAIRGMNHCAVLTSPENYGEFLVRLREHNGCTGIMDRAQFAASAMGYLASLDADISRYLKNLIVGDPATVFSPYKQEKAEELPAEQTPIESFESYVAPTENEIVDPASVPENKIVEETVPLDDSESKVDPNEVGQV